MAHQAKGKHWCWGIHPRTFLISYPGVKYHPQTLSPSNAQGERGQEVAPSIMVAVAYNCDLYPYVMCPMSCAVSAAAAV